MKKMIVLLLSLSLLAGCGQAAQSAAAPTAPPSSAEEGSPSAGDSSASSEAKTQKSGRGEKREASDKGLAGRVSAVDGSTVTLQTMGRMNGGPRPGQDAPEAPPEGQEPPAADESGPAEESSRHSKDKRPGGGRAPKTEELTVTIPDGCEILVQMDGEASAGTMADITADCMLIIAYADDGETVQTVKVLTGAPGRPEGHERPGSDGSTPESASNTTA